MGYVRPTAAVVLGGIAAYVGYALSPDWTGLELVELFVASLTFGTVIVAGLVCCVYGLFAGIEAAVATGAGQTASDGAAD